MHHEQSLCVRLIQWIGAMLGLQMLRSLLRATRAPMCRAQHNHQMMLLLLHMPGGGHMMLLLMLLVHAMGRSLPLHMLPQHEWMLPSIAWPCLPLLPWLGGGGGR